MAELVRGVDYAKEGKDYSALTIKVNIDASDSTRST